MGVPAELRYTKDHEWIKIDGDVATIGITDYAQGELGDIVYVEVDTEGDTLDREETFWNCGSSKNSFRFIYANFWRGNGI